MSPCHLSHPCHPHHPDHPVNTVSPQKIVGNMALMVVMLSEREGLMMMMMVILVMIMMTKMAMMMMLAWSEREEGWLEGWLSLESASGCQYYCQHCQLNLIMMILMPMIENHRKKTIRTPPQLLNSAFQCPLAELLYLSVLVCSSVPHGWHHLLCSILFTNKC